MLAQFFCFLSAAPRPMVMLEPKYELGPELGLEPEYGKERHCVNS